MFLKGRCLVYPYKDIHLKNEFSGPQVDKGGPEPAMLLLQPPECCGTWLILHAAFENEELMRNFLRFLLQSCSCLYKYCPHLF